jgi:hypothetical protein
LPGNQNETFFSGLQPPHHPPLPSPPLTGVFATSGSCLGSFAAEHQNCNFFIFYVSQILIFPMSFSELEVVKIKCNLTLKTEK